MEEGSFIWTEKYRPSDFSEVKGQDEIVKKVKAFVEQKNLPHLLFSGPAGVGKSSLAIVVAKQLFGEDWKHNFLELNSSDERGIDVVRVKVKDFARTKPLAGFPFKLIFLDECDALTKEAQQALRRTMENYTNSTRFLLSCNYVSKIIDPIQSRCVVFKFRPLEKKEIFEIIDKIAKKESIEVSEDAKKALVEISDGDCRKLENILQSCSAVENKITKELVYSMASFAEPKEIKSVLELAVSGDFLSARNKLLDVMLKQGLSGVDIIKQIQKEIWGLNVDNKRKIRMIEKCGDIEFRMTEGSDEFIQLEALLAGFGVSN
jgi:replication factor C small subunit